MENQERNISFFRFEDLRVYGKATDYAAWLCTALGESRNDAQRHLTSVFVRSAANISIIIAEGSSRNKGQFQHYLKNAKTSIRECVAMTEVSKKLGILSPESCERSRELLMELTRMIGALIISLQRTTPRGHDEDEGNDTILPDDGYDPLDSIDTNF